MRDIVSSWREYLYRSPWHWPTRPLISASKLETEMRMPHYNFRLLGQGLYRGARFQDRVSSTAAAAVLRRSVRAEGRARRAGGGVTVDDVEVEHEHTSVFDDDGREKSLRLTVQGAVRPNASCSKAVSRMVASASGPCFEPAAVLAAVKDATRAAPAQLPAAPAVDLLVKIGVGFRLRRGRPHRARGVGATACRSRWCALSSSPDRCQTLQSVNRCTRTSTDDGANAPRRGVRLGRALRATRPRGTGGCDAW